MNVKELIEALQEQVENGNGDMEIKFAYNYGDHWRSQVCEGINNISQVTVKYSDYHSMDKIVEDHREDDEDDCEMTPKPDQRDILILE
jgi:hypothetical protein